MAIESNTLRIFVSYSHEDRKWFDKHPMIPRLARALRQDRVEFWWDERIDGGTKWRSEIETEINKADIAILLVSQGFLDSEFIRDFELPRIESRAKEDKLIVIPILVSYCDWRSIPLLEELQMLPAGQTPLIEYVADAAKYERVQYELLQAIKKQIKKIQCAVAREVTVSKEVPTDELAKKEQRISKEGLMDELTNKKKRRRKLILISILSCLALILGVILLIILINPPIKSWSKTIGGQAADVGRSVYQTKDNGYIITGTTRSFSKGNDDVYLIKTDANGSKKWHKTFDKSGNDYGWSVQQTLDNGYIIAGATEASGAVGNYDFYLIKTDANGNQQWDSTFGGPKWDGAYSVQQTKDSGYIITGSTQSYGEGKANVWLIKTGKNGGWLWDKKFGGESDNLAYSVDITSDGGYIITGYTIPKGKQLKDVYLIKTDSIGETSWTKTFGSSADDDEGRSVQQTSDGGYIITGFTTSYGAGKDVYLIKTDKNGNVKIRQR